MFVAGCGHSPASVALSNLLPEVQLTAAPRPGGSTTFVVALRWSAFDPDGQVQRFVSAIDPPVVGDTTWTATTAMGHIAIAESLDGKSVEWLEKVSDQQYGG